MHDFDTKLLRSFLTVAAERSFSRAAGRLGCSQATMSQRILQLESLLGVALFRRDYHDVTLTPAGQDLRAEAQIVVDAHDALMARVTRGRVAGSVRLGVAEDYVLPMLPQLLRLLRQRLPGVERNTLPRSARPSRSRLQFHRLSTLGPSSVSSGRSPRLRRKRMSRSGFNRPSSESI